MRSSQLERCARGLVCFSIRCVRVELGGFELASRFCRLLGYGDCRSLSTGLRTTIGSSLFALRGACVHYLFSYHRGMSYIPPIPKAHLATYRAAARAYRAARRLGARQHEWHWAAVREVIKRHPEMTHREADGFAQSIIRYVSLYHGRWFWN